MLHAAYWKLGLRECDWASEPKPPTDPPPPPKCPTPHTPLAQAPAQLAAYGVKERVANRWREVVLAQPQQQQPQQRQQAANGRAASTAGPQGEFVNAQQRALFALLSSYSDLLLPCRPYPTDTGAGRLPWPPALLLLPHLPGPLLLLLLLAACWDVGPSLSPPSQGSLLSTQCPYVLPCPARPPPHSRTPYAAAPDPELDAVLLHVLSHCAKAADRIKRNNEHIKAAAEAGTPLEDTPRDQGFTRPKALFLLPLRASALRVALRLAALAVRETRSDSVQGRPRLLAEFGVEGGAPGCLGGGGGGLPAAGRGREVLLAAGQGGTARVPGTGQEGWLRTRLMRPTMCA